ncbi:MAG TPA: hypothetical protein VL096_19630 [Pirellulaceae bacterium]|nr:hypothetical protein [Pirellulaceae bacterium]
MPLKLQDSLAKHLIVAHRIVETIVLRSRGGEVFTVEIGTALQPKTGPAYGAKVTQVSPAPGHIAVCLAPSIDEVFELAQQHIVEAIEELQAEAKPAPRKLAA